MNNSISQIISDEVLKKAFLNTNFGSNDHRAILLEGVEKTAANWHIGWTLTLIIRGLGLGKATPDKEANNLTQKGLDYLKEQYFIKALQPGTPAAQWRVNGEPDPHDSRYDCERAALTLGDHTDDELANSAFMYYDRQLTVEQMMQPDKFTMPIVYMTAVKDRIRWLSRKLCEAKVGQPLIDVEVLINLIKGAYNKQNSEYLTLLAKYAGTKFEFDPALQKLKKWVYDADQAIAAYDKSMKN